MTCSLIYSMFSLLSCTENGAADPYHRASFLKGDTVVPTHSHGKFFHFKTRIFRKIFFYRLK